MLNIRRTWNFILWTKNKLSELLIHNWGKPPWSPGQSYLSSWLITKGKCPTSPKLIMFLCFCNICNHAVFLVYHPVITWQKFWSSIQTIPLWLIDLGPQVISDSQFSSFTVVLAYKAGASIAQPWNTANSDANLWAPVGRCDFPVLWIQDTERAIWASNAIHILTLSPLLFFFFFPLKVKTSNGTVTAKCHFFIFRF